MILTLVGVSNGVLGDIAERSRGTGADVMVRPPGSSVLAFSGNMPQGVVGLIRKQPHVALATGVLVQSIGNFDSITGVHLSTNSTPHERRSALPLRGDLSRVRRSDH